MAASFRGAASFCSHCAGICVINADFEEYEYTMAERFKSKGKFILASVGAAVGLGNALRFPGLCAKYGGGTFLFIYVCSLLLLGIPLLNAEIALGRKVRSGAPECMRSLFRGGDRLGWAQCANSLITAVIYAGLAGWLLSEAITILPACASGEILRSANYFFENVLHSDGSGVISGISPVVCVTVGIVWAAMFFCLKGGADSLSSAAKFTVFAPIALLALFSVRGLFYKNSGEALAALFVPDFQSFGSPELWINALGQVFFSLSLAVGIMPAYGSYLPERCGIFPMSFIIAAADAAVSVLASVALFTTVYGCGLQSSISTSGIITAFSVYPKAIAGLFPEPVVCGIVGTVFYFSIALMAVQSGVSMLEAALSPLLEKFGLPRKRAALVVCVLGGATSIIYATTAADMAVEIADRFINFYDVIILCIAECLALGLSPTGRGLSWEINRYCKKLKMPRKIYLISVGFLCPAALFALALPEIFNLSAGLDYPRWAQFAFGWGACAFVFLSGTIVNFAARPRALKRKKSMTAD